MESQAPIVSLSAVAPSLESTPNKSCQSTTLTISPEVKFVPSISSSSVPTEEETTKPKIPDGGWGWMVVLASLLLSVIADGISFTFGLLYVEFLEEFGASKSTTSWIGSLFMAVPLLTGPIMSAFVDKYGCRSMTILGGLISAIGFIISCRVQTIEVMFLTFGTLAGLGLGLGYVTAVVSIAFWFDKKRTLAVGLGAAGSGIGAFVFSPFTTFLIKEFGWKGTTLILAGMFLNICVCGALMRDPNWIVEQNRKNFKVLRSSKSSKSSLVSMSSLMANDLSELRDLLKSGTYTDYILQNLEFSTNSNNMGSNFQSVVNLPTFIKQNEKVPLEVLEQLCMNKKLYNIIVQNYPHLLLCRSTSDKGLNKVAKNTEIDRVPLTFSVKLKKTEEPKPPVHQYSLPEEYLDVRVPLLSNEDAKEDPLKRRNSFPWLIKTFRTVQPHQNYFQHIKFHPQVRRGAMLNSHKYKLKASSCPHIYRVSIANLEKREDKWYTEYFDMIKLMFDFSLFLELHFLLLSLSTVILFTWFIVPFFYLAEHMIEIEYTEEEISFTMSSIGVANTIGMICLGWAGDKPWMNITITYAVCMVLCGLSCAGMMYFSASYIMLEISAILFGVFLASSFSFTPGILMELVPLERFTLAYGLQLLCMGIGNLLGPPYAGHLFDITKSWEQSFYQAAIWIILSGFLIAFIPFTKNRKIIGSGPVEKEITIEE